MKIKAGHAIRQITISVAGVVAGLLDKKAQFEFTYNSETPCSVAVSMPVDTRFYRNNTLFPIFEMNIPEGFIRYRIIEKLRKKIKVDDMLFLALQGSSGIGCLAYQTDGVEHDQPSSESLIEILAWQGDTSLFEELISKYLLLSTISGVQPKVMVSETIINSNKADLILPSLIVKSGDKEFPQLAINEYICMRLAKACNIETPAFWLSEDHQLFVMRRFDLTADGRCLSMEDMAVLQGKSTNDKYQSSYEAISKVIRFYSSAVNADNEILFKMVVHSCMVGNGDGHLKNFALLYDDVDNMRLSPLYDVVNTQLYNPGDTLALNLGKSKIFPDRKRIVDLGKGIGVTQCETIVDEMADNIRDELDALRDYTALMSLDIRNSIVQNIYQTSTRTAIKTCLTRRSTKFK